MDRLYVVWGRYQYQAGGWIVGVYNLFDDAHHAALDTMAAESADYEDGEFPWEAISGRNSRSWHGGPREQVITISETVVGERLPL
jgi:hypothetical protein